MLPVRAYGSKTRRWHSHRSACSAVAPGGRTPNRNRGRPCSWPSGRGPRPPPPQSAPSVFAAATRPPTAASGSQSSDRSVENCSLPGYHQGASRWRYSTPANPIKSDRLLGVRFLERRCRSEIAREIGADAREDRNVRLRHDKTFPGYGLVHVDIDPRGLENDVTRDRRDRVAIRIATLAHPAAYEVLVEALWRPAGGEALLVAVGEPVAAAVRSMDLVGENDPARRVEAEFIFGIGQDKSAFRRDLAPACEQPECEF